MAASRKLHGISVSMAAAMAASRRYRAANNISRISWQNKQSRLVSKYQAKAASNVMRKNRRIGVPSGAWRHLIALA